jgi:hypothetical protein
LGWFFIIIFYPVLFALGLDNNGCLVVPRLLCGVLLIQGLLATLAAAHIAWPEHIAFACL